MALPERDRMMPNTVLAPLPRMERFDMSGDTMRDLLARTRRFFPLSGTVQTWHCALIAVAAAVLLGSIEPTAAQPIKTALPASPDAEAGLHQHALTAEEMAAVLLDRTGGRARSIRMKAAPGPKPGVLAFKVNFAHDSDRIDPTAHGFLTELGRLMKMPEMKGRALVVEGHTDATGGDVYNDALSLRRANAIIAHLSRRHGIPTARLLPVGRGERELFDRDNPDSGVNRRVQFYLPGTR